MLDFVTTLVSALAFIAVPYAAAYLYYKWRGPDPNEAKPNPDVRVGMGEVVVGLVSGSGAWLYVWIGSIPVDRPKLAAGSVVFGLFCGALCYVVRKYNHRAD